MNLMMTNLALAAYIAPLSLFLAALMVSLSSAPMVNRVFHIGRGAAIGSFLLSLAVGVAVFTSGVQVSPIIGLAGLGISLRLDPLSVVMFWLVTFLGTLLIQFSRNYLDGDPRQSIFLSRLYLTISTVLFLVLSGNLWQLVLAWIGTSFALHRLLVFYPTRPRAIIAARKKFIVARAGDICLVVAAILVARTFGTSDLGEIHKAASSALSSGIVPEGLSLAVVLIVAAAALKSAMFPFHGWLLEVMETPTPVSALLHAGLLNAGTFLVVRLSDVVALSTPAVILLIAIGGFTAMFASSAMITQGSVKVSLAYSSAAHMGFMLMLCGFGAYRVAIMHLVAHSCYKAHAFLSSGSIIEYAQNTGSQKLNKVPHPLALFINLAVSLAIFIATAAILGIDATHYPGETALGAIFVIAVTYLLVKGTTEKAHNYIVIGRTVLMAVLVTVAFFALELVATTLLGNVVVAFPTPDMATVVAMVLAVIAFSMVTLFSALLPVLSHRPTWRIFYVHLKNGFYANALFDRLLNLNINSKIAQPSGYHHDN